jgi:hypothetical protein
VVTVALNILYGAAVLLRLHLLRCQGLSLPPAWSRLEPLGPEQLSEVVSSQ